MTESDKEEIKDIIRLTVNGKIDRLSDALAGHIQITNKYIETMEPVRDALLTFQNLMRFSKFLGLPALGFVIVWVFKTLLWK